MVFLLESVAGVADVAAAFFEVEVRVVGDALRTVDSVDEGVAWVSFSGLEAVSLWGGLRVAFIWLGFLYMDGPSFVLFDGLGVTTFFVGFFHLGADDVAPSVEEVTGDDLPPTLEAADDDVPAPFFTPPNMAARSAIFVMVVVQTLQLDDS